uniref:PIPK domain-containing protein n=1 Tax=Mucochytrium quahogii TaxID=96639 RepID=A0A7S2SHP4_9STRA|mmetsp:Transcript_18470/g.30085  ORF Transcript_18470/g.30085 Transcript_18470/m.30085 type:complete len:701 (+) Transcript_18470:1774-3876(+)
MWGCPRCTLENDGDAATCAACDGARVSGEMPPAAPRVEQVPLANVNVQATWNVDAGAEAIPVATVASSVLIKENQGVTEESVARWISVAVELARERSWSFSSKDFVDHVVGKGLVNAESSGVYILQKQLVDSDTVHSVPYILHPVVRYDSKQLFKFGRRYHAKQKQGESERVHMKCEMCGEQGLAQVQEGNVVEWTCPSCTFINIKQLSEPPTPDGAKFGITSLNPIPAFHRMFVQGDPEPEAVAEIVRTSIQAAVLEDSSRGGPGDISHVEEWMHEFLAIDRSMRGEDENYVSNTKVGLRSSYAPLIMKRLRCLFGVSEDFFCESLFDHALKLKGNEGGRSGSFFLFSADKHFVVKSVTKSEVALMMGILPSWYEHCLNNRDTLLPRLFGIYKIAVGTRAQDVYYFMVTNNAFDSPVSIDEVYDMKGSTAKRFVSPLEQDEAIKATGKLPTLKDLNWKHRIYPDPSELGIDLFKQIEADTAFLVSHNIMDYSLLVGVHSGELTGCESNCPVQRSIYQKHFGGIRSQYGGTYFVSLIDVLQSYDFSKQMERFMKTKVLTTVHSYVMSKQNEETLTCPRCRVSRKMNRASLTNNNTLDPGAVIQVQCYSCGLRYGHAPMQKVDQNISSVEPKTYRMRFLEFVQSRVLVAERRVTVVVPNGVWPGDPFEIHMDGCQWRVFAPANSRPGAHVEVAIPVLNKSE